MQSLSSVRSTAISGLVPPSMAEALIRTTFPAVTRVPLVAGLGKALMLTYLLAPLAWLMLAPFYFMKILPFIARRYTLTNRRLMIQRGLKPKAVEEIALADIDEVRVPPGSVDDFYRAGTLEVLSKGQVKLTLTGVPEPEAFKHAIVNACLAWVPGKAAAWMKFIPAKVDEKK